MSDISHQDDGASDNIPELSVSELSQAIKRTLEGRFERVRVRGEISGFKRAASGHLYMALKDENAVLDAVCWRGLAGRLTVAPEDGLEVVATGRITAYPGRSKYQIVIESLELAGEGALLKLLEERRKKLAAEGLFEAERKRPLPFLPQVIGVVTSPTGAVIRDILHRLADRFPRRVLVWPVLVQGEGAAEQVAAAIDGFNRLRPDGTVPRPDLLIVARGGGSLEDLWAFNEEVVVRAAAASEIPLISAVGHETDTTLIDFAADLRAPTPTAAAEMAVPVRGELASQLRDLDRRLIAATGRMVEERRVQVEGLGRGLPDPVRLVEELTQRLDERAERLATALKTWLQTRGAEVARLSAALPHPRQQLRLARERATAQGERLGALGRRLADPQRQSLGRLDAGRRLGQTMARRLDIGRTAMESLERVLESTSYHKVLGRGFAVVRGPDGLLSGPEGVAPGLPLDIEFARDRHLPAVAGKTGTRRKAPARETAEDDPQGSLL
jgi:exodeoxyribonuclease VII large subunit